MLPFVHTLEQPCSSAPCVCGLGEDLCVRDIGAVFRLLLLVNLKGAGTPQ